MMGLSRILLGFCLVLALSSSAHAESWNGKILRVKDSVTLTLQDLSEDLVGSREIILGEKHDTQAIQDAESKVIGAAASKLSPGNFTTAWEFLDYTDQSLIKDAFARFSTGAINASEFLTLTQGKPKYLNYAPILEVTRNLGGQFIGVNLPRKLKEPVVANGIGAAVPDSVPIGFELGSTGYLERFQIAMDGHATADQISNYFAAQCLTDDVMAVHLLQDATTPLRFLVVGSFHTDFNDGVVARLVRRAPDQVVRVVRFIDASDYTVSELAALPHDPKYGDLADFIYFVNEPKP